MADYRAVAEAYRGKLDEAADRGKVAAARERRQVDGVWTGRAKARGASKRQLAKLGLGGDAEPVEAAERLRAADLRLAELAHLAGVVRPGPSLRRIGALSDRRREAGARYAAIFEELTLGAGSSWLEERVDGGGRGDGGQMRRARLVEARDRAQAALGDHIALRPTRKPRGKQGPDPRRQIPLRALVDLVCLGGWSLEAVLIHYGWKEPSRKVRGSTTVRLRRRLEIGLDVIEAAWSGGQVATVGRPARICAAKICTAGN